MVTYRSIEQTINTITYLVKPHRLGVVARMYPDNTLNFIVDGLRNVYYKDEKPASYELSTSLLFEWQVFGTRDLHKFF